MSILLPTLAATTAAGVLSFACVSVVALTARPHWVPRLVSSALGALLGAVFLEILPHALSMGQPPEKILGVVLAGILMVMLGVMFKLSQSELSPEEDQGIVLSQAAKSTFWTTSPLQRRSAE